MEKKTTALLYSITISILVSLCCSVLFPDLVAASFSDEGGDILAGEKMAQVTRQDHSEFEELHADFESGPEVTAVCLSCHDHVGKEIKQSHLWTWNCPSGREYKVGKSGYTLNNMSISPVPNAFACYKCHISYRWEDPSLTLDSQENIDCLICHEQTKGMYDEYRKEWNPNLKEIAQNIGRPTRRNCGKCHFYRSGGDGALRGDLHSNLLEASLDKDVHMAINGPDLDCIDCHITHNHIISARCYENSAKISNSGNNQRYDCTSCHRQQDLHQTLSKINDHIDRVACETCHIPMISRGFYSRIWADYSKAGRKKDGKIILTKNEHGKKEYSTRSGEWRWAKDITPEYFWFNGGFEYTLATDKIDPSRKVKLNYTNTDYNDPQAKIYPFKVHRTKQPYDKINNTMVLPKFTDKNKDSGAYWIDYDWNKAIKAGMEEMGLAYSGEYGFVITEYLYPIHHMVMPKEKALKCIDCHRRNDGRFEQLSGFYIPGRDRSFIIEYSGLLCVLVAVSSVLLHAFVNIVRRSKRGGL